MKKQNIAARIRELIAEDPTLTTAKLKEILGTMTRSIETQFGYEYKKMYGHQRGVDCSIREAILRYCNEHPGATPTDIRKDLKLTSAQISSAIQYAEKSGVHIPCRRDYSPEQIGSDAYRIRRYAIEHPFASSTECAKALGVSRYNANNVLVQMRKKGLLPPKNRGRSALAPSLVREIVDLKRAGYTIPEIAKAIGVSYTTVQRYLKENADQETNEPDSLHENSIGII